MKKLCIVTGASSGMGVCFGRQLAQETAKLKSKAKKYYDKGKKIKADKIISKTCDEIWLIARRLDKLDLCKNSIDEEKNKSLLKDFYPQIKTFSVDLDGKDGALKIKELLEKENDIEISILVNNAGFGTYGEFANTSTLREMQMIDVNCTALTGITGFALPYMKKGARIINTASLASFLPLGNFAVYGATKAFVLSFSIALAAELKHKGISVTSLCPGPVSTEFANVASKGARKEVRHGKSPEKTVEHCIKASLKGKHYSMFAFKWRFKARASRFVGRYLGAWFTYKFCKRPSN